MAARVKQHNAARRQLLEGGEHSGEIHPAGGAVEPGIGMYLKAGAGKDGNVVLRVGSLTQTAESGSSA